MGVTQENPSKYSQTVLAAPRIIDRFSHTYTQIHKRYEFERAETLMHILKHFSGSKSSVSAINPISNYWQ